MMAAKQPVAAAQFLKTPVVSAVKPEVSTTNGLATKKKKTRRPKKVKSRKPKIIPFSREMAPLESDQELTTLLADMKLDNKVYLSFEDMGLKPELLKGIYSYGLEKPATIQQQAIVPCVKGRDVIVQAQSGMGKTAALLISALQRLDLNNPHCQILIVTPTRELAEQIHSVIADNLGKLMKATSLTCIGGTPITRCIVALQAGKQIVVGTPGRILHMMESETENGGGLCFKTDSIKTLAFDEADKMLTAEFSGDLTNILRKVPNKAQIILMSATMPPRTMKLTSRFMRKPLTFLVGNQDLTLEGIQQYYLNVEKEEFKLEVFSDIYNQVSKAQGMIFCNTRARVTRISKQMRDLGHIVSAMSSEFTQTERELILNEFRQNIGASRMLITSDLLARGIDVQQVNLVINYDMPTLHEEYIHRVGRGGRYGRKGVAITFVTAKELDQLKKLEEFYSTHIPEIRNVKGIDAILAPLSQ